MTELRNEFRLGGVWFFNHGFESSCAWFVDPVMLTGLAVVRLQELRSFSGEHVNCLARFSLR